jgi:hypothetical protein
MEFPNNDMEEFTITLKKLRKNIKNWDKDGEKDGYDVDKLNITLNHAYKYDNHYVFPLTKSLKYNDLMKYGINFSRADDIIMNIRNKKDNCDDLDSCGYIYGVSVQPIRVVNGICGLAFSK